MDTRTWIRAHPWVPKTYVLLLVVVPLASTIYALAAFSWYRGSIADIVLFVVFYVLTALGITMGFHRMLTHKSFDCHPVVKFVLLALGCMAIEGNPIRWASTHLKHHAHADKQEDPHSPMRGLWYAHVGWMANPDAFPNPREVAPHLLDDRLAVFFQRTFFLWAGLSLALPAIIGGWSGLLWGGLVRIFFTHHVTWSVNSVCHMFGRRPFKTSDLSSNNWVVSLLAFGEGWHNNHHAFPQSAFHGLKLWQLDPAGTIIWLLRMVRLVWNVHVPSPVVIALKEIPKRSQVSAGRS